MADLKVSVAEDDDKASRSSRNKRSSGGGEKKEAEKPLVLALGDLKPSGKGWSLEVGVRLSTSKKLAEDKTVLFFPESGGKPLKVKVEDDKKVADDPHGVKLDCHTRRTHAAIIFEKGGDQKFYAIIKDDTEQSKVETIKVPKEPGTKPAKFDIQIVGTTTGKYRLTIRVLDKEDKPMKKVPFRIQERDSGDVLKDVSDTDTTTGKDGLCMCEVQVDPGGEKNYLFSAGALSESRSFYGPNRP
jgi:hypothetical protein